MLLSIKYVTVNKIYWGDFVLGDFVLGDVVLGGILSRGIFSGGFCPGGFCPDTIFLRINNHLSNYMATDRKEAL